ncbi:hypothetical protein LshimejAT787_0702580 [Lyophyllum shimeji]|uniref:F-box domain-containing protein n=1 Tax=Lyophyllum shimeji TaxID=47721 RepID=A0A9P3PPM3_LYOSH|nr:hypothetical protein LshimejAT787_0702580 [Lyophyllum shimeji]
MVSADSLNLDVLELIFAHLSGNDLPAVALVSKSFLAGVIPRLYRTLSFRIHHAKRYSKASTSFATILAHPDLAVHVQHIDIRYAPIYHDRPHPDFIRECTRTLELCDNLKSFVYTPSATQAILPMLQGKDRLRDIRINARFSTSQSATLAKLGKIERLTLEYGTWEVMDVLPRWTESIGRSLTSLTLYMSTSLNSAVLETALSHLPRLLALHIIGCPNVDHAKVLKLISHTPLLESLALNITEAAQPPELPSSSSLGHLRHLALEARSGMTANPASPATLLSILTHVKSSFPTLTSAALKIPDFKPEASHAVIKKLLVNHAATLQKLFFVDSIVEMRSIMEICAKSHQLEMLSLPLPMKEIMTFGAAISESKSLRTIIDSDAHVTHGPQPSLNAETVQSMMHGVRTLNRIVSDRRVWTALALAAFAILFAPTLETTPSTLIVVIHSCVASSILLTIYVAIATVLVMASPAPTVLHYSADYKNFRTGDVHLQEISDANIEYEGDAPQRVHKTRGDVCNGDMTHRRMASLQWRDSGHFLDWRAKVLPPVVDQISDLAGLAIVHMVVLLGPCSRCLNLFEK